jgi:stearoyl-CoA desaturase (delta-9 desaturase)
VIDQDVRGSYDGTGPFPDGGAADWTGQRRTQVAVTGLIVLAPFAGLAVAVALLWGHGIGLADVFVAVGLYLLTGFGVTVGFHRLLTHRSFVARPGCGSPWRSRAR